MYWTVGADGGASHLQRLQSAARATCSAPARSRRPTRTGCGSLLETTEGGKAPVELPPARSADFLEDGDEVILRARARREGFAPIGFGECRGTVLKSA